MILIKTGNHATTSAAHLPAYSLACVWACVLTCLLALSGCASQKAPAMAEVAVSRAAVDSATSAGAAEAAPLEMQAARDKLARASAALNDKDYAQAYALASQAEADARLAQSKAGSAKAVAAAAALQESVRVLREELQRQHPAPQLPLQQ